MSIPLLEVVLGLTLILVVKWIWRRKQDLQKLQKLGYSVPPVSFIGGNLIELFTRYVTDTGKSLSEALFFAEHWENMLCKKIVLNQVILNFFRFTCSSVLTVFVTFVYFFNA